MRGEITGSEMKQQIFKPGAIVQCGSGGPPMTVVEYTDEGVVCTWMARTSRGSLVHSRTGTFPEFTLFAYRYSPQRRTSNAR
jgi:uncharacterized protein YodC (DUF2158 family)